MKTLLTFALLAVAQIAAPSATAQNAPREVVTLEDLCNGGATEFTDEHAVTVQCPTEPAPASADREVGAWLICGYIASPVCPRIFRDNRVTSREWQTLLRPYPNWDHGNGFAKDVCTERDSLRTDRACYRAWLRFVLEEHRGVPSSRDYITDRELAWFDLSGVQAGYPPGDARCTFAYQIDTRWRFWADDEPNCRQRLTRPRADRYWITLEDICGGAAPERNVVITDEHGTEIACPAEPEETTP